MKIAMWRLQNYNNSFFLVELFGCMKKRQYFCSVKLKNNTTMADKIYLWSAHGKNNCLKHSYCYARKEYTNEQVATMLKESNEFKDCTDIVVRSIDKHEIAGVCAYQPVINLQPSTDEMWLLRKLINKTKNQ